MGVLVARRFLLTPERAAAQPGRPQESMVCPTADRLKSVTQRRAQAEACTKCERIFAARRFLLTPKRVAAQPADRLKSVTQRKAQAKAWVTKTRRFCASRVNGLLRSRLTDSSLSHKRLCEGVFVGF